LCPATQELRSLKFEKCIKGKLPCDDHHFPGFCFLEVCNKDKTHKLSVSNHTVFNERRNRRLVAHPDDPLSAFVLFENLESIKHPDQSYIFMRELGEKRKVELRSQGLSQVRTQSTNHIGVTSMNKVRKLATLLLHKLKTQSLTRIGLTDWEKYTNHCSRQYGISRVVNNPNSNPVETMCFARHASITSQLPYNRPRGEANAAFQTFNQSKFQWREARCKKSTCVFYWRKEKQEDAC
jgi:hypothetical protein